MLSALTLIPPSPLFVASKLARSKEKTNMYGTRASERERASERKREREKRANERESENEHIYIYICTEYEKVRVVQIFLCRSRVYRYI